jgi:predicted ATPase/DNA-binding XRE family transcriptional regulator
MSQTAAPGGRSEFGLALRRFRLRAALSQEQLAECARLSLDSIGALERGTRRSPYRETVSMLAEALGLSDTERDELQELARRRGRPRSPSRPSLDSQRRVQNNLPLETTPLRGRENALEQGRRLLTERRLVTVVGAGGIGKTRFAAALAATFVSSDLDAIWFVELAPLDSGTLVAGTVARAVGVRQPSERGVASQIVEELATKRGILILDNCEHVRTEAAALVKALHEGAPSICILSTSRQSLHVEGEAVYHLASLDVPARGAALPAGEAMRYGAIALFVDRATAADASFRLTDETVPAVTEICTQLDGIALALELAAARSKVLSLSSIATRLNSRFRLLTGGQSKDLGRHRTLSALIDWSYDLLAPPQRALLNRIAICAGGFTLDTAVALYRDERVDAFDVLDLLTALVDQSLVVADTSGQEERYRLLESTRAYALDRLDACGEREQTSHRHAAYFAQIARAADARFGSMPREGWLAALEKETGNFRRALEWSLGTLADVATGGAIAGHLERFWINAGLEAEGRRWIGLALEHLDERDHTAISARLWRAAAWLNMGPRKHDAARRAVALYEALGDAIGLGDSLRQQAIGASQRGDLDAAALMNARALEIFRVAGDRRNIANCLDLSAGLAQERGDYRAARASYEAAIALFWEIGSEGGAASATFGLSQTAFLEGDPQLAVALARDVRKIRMRGKYATNLVGVNVALTTYLVELGEIDEASQVARAGLEWAQAARNAGVFACAIVARALVAAVQGDAHEAARLRGYANAALARLGFGRDRAEQRLDAMLLVALRRHLGEGAIERLAVEGSTWSENAAAEACGMTDDDRLSGEAAASPEMETADRR